VLVNPGDLLPLGDKADSTSGRLGWAFDLLDCW